MVEYDAKDPSPLVTLILVVVVAVVGYLMGRQVERDRQGSRIGLRDIPDTLGGATRVVPD